MTTLETILDQLKALGNPANLEGMARYGIRTDRSFGVKMGDVKALVKAHRKDHPLALALWDSGYREARLLAAHIADPRKVTPRLMETWVRQFDSWDVCDTTTNRLFRRTPFAFDKALAWSRSDELFTKRAGYALMAGLALKTNRLGDDAYEPFLDRIKAAATDDRNLIKKAVNWALRQIGKRNAALNLRAVTVAEELLAQGNSTARWIANDALKELQSEAVQKRLSRI